LLNASLTKPSKTKGKKAILSLIHRMVEPKAVFLIFSTGRIVCTGAKTKEIVGEAVEKLAEQVKEYGIAQVKGEGNFNSDEVSDLV